MVRRDIKFAFQASSPKTSGPARPALFLWYCVEDWSADSNEPLSGRASDPQESEAAGEPGRSAAAAAPMTENAALPLRRLGRRFSGRSTRRFFSVPSVRRCFSRNFSALPRCPCGTEKTAPLFPETIEVLMGLRVASLFLGLLVVISCNLPEIRHTFACRTPEPHVRTVFYLATTAAGYAVALSLFYPGFVGGVDERAGAHAAIKSNFHEITHEREQTHAITGRRTRSQAWVIVTYFVALTGRSARRSVIFEPRTATGSLSHLGG